MYNKWVAFKEEGIQKIATEDPVYQMFMAKVTANDWHARKSWEATCLKPFYSVRDRLSTSNNLVIYSYEQGPARVVIPEALRTKIAANLHAGH